VYRDFWFPESDDVSYSKSSLNERQYDLCTESYYTIVSLRSVIKRRSVKPGLPEGTLAYCVSCPAGIDCTSN